MLFCSQRYGFSFSAVLRVGLPINDFIGNFATDSLTEGIAAFLTELLQNRDQQLHICCLSIDEISDLIDYVSTCCVNDASF